MNINQQLRFELGQRCGLFLIEDERLAEALSKWETLRDDQFGDEEIPNLTGAYQIPISSDEDPTNPMIEIIAMCAKNPGRTTWAVVWGQVGGLETAYWFPVDSVPEAVHIINQGCESLS